jgi:hypothetical protein
LATQIEDATNNLVVPDVLKKFNETKDSPIDVAGDDAAAT